MDSSSFYVIATCVFFLLFYLKMKQDDKIFLDALQALLEKERKELVKELKKELGSIGLSFTSGSQSSTVISPSQKSNKVEIDESIVVTSQNIQDVEKNFDSLVESETTKDSEATSSVNKLKALKKG